MFLFLLSNHSPISIEPCAIFTLGILSATALKQPPPWLEGAVSGVSAVGVAMVASAAKSLLIKTCSDKNTLNAKVDHAAFYDIFPLI